METKSCSYRASDRISEVFHRDKQTCNYHYYNTVQHRKAGGVNHFIRDKRHSCFLFFLFIRENYSIQNYSSKYKDIILTIPPFSKEYRQNSEQILLVLLLLLLVGTMSTLLLILIINTLFRRIYSCFLLIPCHNLVENLPK